MNKNNFLLFLLAASFLQASVINSNLIEFNNKFYIPNDYKPYTGKVIEYYSDGLSVYFEGIYKDGIKEGPWMYYDINGELALQKNFKNSSYIHSEFYPHSQIKLTGEYINNLKNGLWISYYENGTIKSESFFKDGYIDIYRTIEYEKKSLNLESELKNDILNLDSDTTNDVTNSIDSDSNVVNSKNGEHLTYHENGLIKKRENYINNVLHGIWIEYYENGREYINRFFNHGEINHDYKTVIYYQSGNKKEEFHEQMNKDVFIKNGAYISYLKHGIKHMEGVFKNNIKVGEWVEYYDTGEKFILYNYGDINPFNVSETDFDVYVSFFHKNGNASIEAYILKDNELIFNGEYRSFFSSGVLKEKGRFIDGFKNGLWYEYYEDGNTLSFTNYIDGTGSYSSFYNTGETLLVGEYYNGGKNGLWTEYYINGMLKKELNYLDGLIDINKVIVEYREDGSKYADYYVKALEGEIIKDGLFTIYYPSENINTQGVLSNNLKEGKWIEYYDGGLQMSEITYENGAGFFISYYESGNILANGKYVDYKKEDKWIYYYENGKKSEEYYYINDFFNPNKKYITWYENGYKKNEGYIIYLDEEVVHDGYYTEYYDNGIVFSEGNYLLGKKDGIWKEYYITRILSVEKKFNNGIPDGEWIFYNEIGDILKIERY